MVRLNRLTEGLDCEVIVKLESQNPGGSVKDRLGFAMIDAGRKKWLINKNTVIIEPTSGNTGVGLAFVCAAKVQAIIVMPDSVSIERRMIVHAYGGEVVLTPGKEGMKSAIAKAEEIQGIPRKLHSNAICQSSQPRNAQENNCERNLGRYRWKNRYFCCWFRNRRDNYRSLGGDQS